MQSILIRDAPTIAEALARQLRTEIALGTLEPGARITEERLADRFGVSRTPVREALRMLARESLLELRPNTGYVVTEVSLADMEDLYALRVAVEEQMARHIVDRGAPAELQPLRELWSQQLPAAHADAALVRLDEQFHETLADASGSTVFAETLRNINTRLHVLRVRDFVEPTRVRRTFEQHLHILDELQKADARLAAALLRAHIWESHAFVRASYLAARVVSGGGA